MTTSAPAVETKKIGQFYRDAFERIRTSWQIPPIEVRFYPYIGINHTIRIRDGKVLVRITDICRDMPADVHNALASILVAKLFRRKVPAPANRLYSKFIDSPTIRRRVAENRRTRGRKLVSSHAGSTYDLDEIFDRQNAKYFGGQIPKPALSWSVRATFRTLGHHDAAHETIVVSRSLDSPDVPRYVVEYIVFHEILHIHHPTRHVNGRRYNHTAEFRRDEEKFAQFREAEDWIAKNVGKLRRRAKKSRGSIKHHY